jgi:hypothetical protein
MRPGRIKHKARARHRRIAVTAAGVSALTVMGGTAAYATGGGWDGGHKQDGDASLENGGDAKIGLDQSQYAFTAQLALANTGANKALGITGNINLGEQDCLAGNDGGDIKGVDDDNTTGNTGGDCTNDATQSNDGTSKAEVKTGAATGKNDAKTTVNQRNDGDASVNNTANDNTIESDDEGDASLSNGGNANLWVNQHSGVETWQGAAANSGHNLAISGTIGVNLGSQIGTGGVGGGNIGWSGDGNHAGNSGGNASNTASQSNTGSSTASITTGAATASNTSATTVNQTNTGNASSTNTANGNTITSD